MDSLRKELGGDLEKVKNELSELSKYESFKKTIDGKLHEQQVEFQEVMNKAHMQITGEAKKYQQVLADLDQEKASIALDRKQLQDLSASEAALKDKLTAVSGVVEALRKKVEAEDTTVKGAEQRIINLGKLADKIEVDVKEKKEKDLKPLLKLSEEHAVAIRKMEQDIIEKSKQAKEGIDEYLQRGTAASNKIMAFFQKRVQIEHLLNDLDHEQESLKAELQKLQKKAIAFSISSKSAPTEQFEELQKKFKEIETRKSWFKQELEKLNTLLK